MTDAKFNSDSFVRHLQRLLRKFGSVGTITNRAALPCSKMHKEFVCDNDRLEILHRPRSFLSITSLNNADINQSRILSFPVAILAYDAKMMHCLAISGIKDLIVWS